MDLVCAVSYALTCSLGILAKIMGVVWYAVDNPTLPAYIEITHPLATCRASLWNLPLADDVQTAKEEHNLLKRNWAVVKGF